MLQREVISPASTLFSTDTCACVITVLSPGHMLFTHYGYNRGEIGDACYSAMDDMIAKAGFVVAFIDSREQVGISAKERDRATEWARKQGDKYRAGHLLFRSKLIELAVAIGNLVLRGSTRCYSDVNEFEKVIAAHVPSFKKLPDFGPRLVRLKVV